LFIDTFSLLQNDPNNGTQFVLKIYHNLKVQVLAL